MNFRNVLLLASIGLVAIAVAGFVPHSDDFGKMIAGSLVDGGKFLLGAAVGVLAPIVRTIYNGERAGDRPAETTPEAKQSRAKPDGT